MVVLFLISSFCFFTLRNYTIPNKLLPTSFIFLSSLQYSLIKDPVSVLK